MGKLATQGDEDALLLRQESALIVCDARGNTLVELIDHYNEAVAPKKAWYKFWSK